MKKNTLVIIDGNAIIHRAYHALPPLTKKDGTIVNAVYGFASMLLKVLSDVKPTHIAVCFDVPGGTFRDEIFEDYKATREKADQELYDQIPLIHDLVETCNIPIFTKEGFEADDVIGTIATQVQQDDQFDEILIVTGDKDLLQLVDDNKIKVYLLRKGMSDIVMYDEQKVHEKFSFGPKQVIDYKALCGDSSDNIPGVTGVGDKTATIIINAFGTVDSLYEKIANDDPMIEVVLKPGVIKKLKAQQEQALMSYDLATIRTDVEGVEFSSKEAVIHELPTQDIAEFLKEYEFFSLIKRLPGQNTPKKQIKQSAASLPTYTVEPVDDEKVASVVKDILAHGEFACSLYTSSADMFEGTIQDMVVVYGDHAVHFSLTQIGDEQRKQVFSLFNSTAILVGHDIKPLIKQLLAQGHSVSCPLFDLMVASYVLDSSRAHDLEALAQRELGVSISTSTKQQNLFGADTKAMAQELAPIFSLYKKLRNDLTQTDANELCLKTEMPLVLVLARMEVAGVAIDSDELRVVSEAITNEVEQLSQDIWKLSGEEFNIASSVQLREVLFAKMHLPTAGIKKGKTGYSTAASELEKLRDEHEIIEYIEQYRELTKIQNTYAEVLPTLVHKKTGRIHALFNQTVAATGRLSSSDPNLQNIPIRTALGKKIRDSFVAQEGYKLIAADYSQIELRIVASLAKDKRLIGIFEQGQDIHTATAAAINNVELADVTKQMRSAAKEVNFGVLYGMGAFGLSSRTGISMQEAKTFIDKYFTNFSGVKTYIEQTKNYAYQNGFVETLFGRRRYIPELQSSNHQMKQAGERMAVNMPVQGTQADIVKMAMVNIQKKLDEVYDSSDIRMIMQVHDELVFEVRESLAEKISEEIKELMETIVTLDVPIVVEAHVGDRWGNLK